MAEERLNPLNTIKDQMEDAKKQADDYKNLAYAEFTKTPGAGMTPARSNE